MRSLPRSKYRAVPSVALSNVAVSWFSCRVPPLMPSSCAVS